MTEAPLSGTCSGRLVETFEGHTASLRGAVFSPDGRTLYTASSDGSVIAWDVSGGRRLGRPFRYSARTRKVRTGSAVGPDGLLIAASLIREFPAGSTVTCSPDGRTLAVGDSDGVTPYDVRTGRQRKQLFGNGTSTQEVDFSGDRKLLASADLMGVVTFWNVATGDSVATPPGPAAFCVRFSPDAKLVAVGDSSGRVMLWNAATHKLTGPALVGTAGATARSTSRRTARRS